MTTGQMYSEASIDSVHQLVTFSRQSARILRTQADDAARVQRIWEDLASYLDHSWPLHILDLFERESGLLKKMRADGHAAVQPLEDIYRIAKAQSDDMRHLLPKYLEDACKANHLPLDGDSRHPKYTFQNGFFRVEIDDAKRIARISDNEGELAKFPADTGAIVEAVRREQTRVFGRTFNGNIFIKKLRNQYLAILKKIDQPDGTSIPIRSITHRLGKNEKGFRTDEFLADLSRLVHEGPTGIDGYQLDLQQTKDTNQGMLLHGQAGRGYIGFVIFRKG